MSRVSCPFISRVTSRLTRRSAAVLAATLLVILTAGGALAAEALGGKLLTGNTINVPAGTTVDHDLYAFAGTIIVDGTINGDLVVAGGTVRVSGTVTGDVIAAGGTVDISGTVNGDVREAGGQVTVAGAVGEDLLAAGGQVTVTSSAKVGEDVILYAGTAAMDGTVTGSIEGNAGSYTKSGSVGGTDNVKIGSQRERPAPAPSAPVLDAIRHFIVVFLFGALALWLLPRAVEAAEGVLRNRTLVSVGSGLLAIIGYIVAVVVLVLLITLLAIVFGLLGFGNLVAVELTAGILAVLILTFAIAVIAAFVVDALVGLLVGRLLLPTLSRDAWQQLAVLAIGAGLVVILSSLPYVGGWVKLAVICLGLGAITVAVWARWRRSSPATVETPGLPPPPPSASPPAPAG